MISDAIKIAILKSAPRLSHIELIELVVQECELQRQWVGLDKEERKEIAVRWRYSDEVIAEIEAKLRSKNT